MYIVMYTVYCNYDCHKMAQEAIGDPYVGFCSFPVCTQYSQQKVYAMANMNI